MAPPKLDPKDGALSDRLAAGSRRQQPYEVDEHSGADDEDDDDDEDDYDDSETSSNYSSVSGDPLPAIHAHGHTYHGSGRLLSPNDESEARRMALQHELFKLCLGGALVSAKLPLANTANTNGHHTFDILDVGTGSGLWAIEMAQTYPQVRILGTDLSSALLPKEVPPNLTFEIADAAEPWPPRQYDFIHMRNLTGGGIRDWGALMRSAYEHLKPGGQLEFTEVRPRFFDVDNDPENAALPDLDAGEKPRIGAACLEFEVTLAEMCMSIQLDIDPVPRVTQWLTELGAEGIRERADWLPVYAWGSDPVTRRKGELLGEMIDTGLENWTMYLFGMCGWKDEETRELLERVKQERRDPKLRCYASLSFITGRKPLS
ncbi:Secondary metabolism regulator LAE1 [Paramyrothecium foliicola]|nr:Secondary metabolism regulator LAE1 [Paramyrothecium foliicola]